MNDDTNNNMTNPTDDDMMGNAPQNSGSSENPMSQAPQMPQTSPMPQDNSAPATPTDAAFSQPPVSPADDMAASAPEENQTGELNVIHPPADSTSDSHETNSEGLPGAAEAEEDEHKDGVA